MEESVWEFSESDGSVVVHTGVTGPAARTGHRLTITMRAWTAVVTVKDLVPERITATITVDSMQVTAGEGGLTPMTGAEKSLARMNALKSMHADKYPEISYEAESFTAAGSAFRADGAMTIRGRTRPLTLDFAVVETAAGRQISTEATITQSDFGIKPYSLMMGTLKVADEVRVTVDVAYPR